MSQKPITEFRYGSVRAAVWQNQTPAGIMYNVSVSRSYLTKANEWAESNSYSDRDLPALAKAANDAHSYIQQLKQNAEVVTNLPESEDEQEQQLAEAA